MKSLLLYVFLSLILVTCSSPLQECDFENYRHFIHVRRQLGFDSSYYLQKRIITTNNDCYSKAFKALPSYFDYLLNNFYDKKSFVGLDTISDSIRLQNMFYDALSKDRIFNNIIEDYFQKVFMGQTKKLIDQKELLNIAVKFFLVEGIDKEERFVGKVCGTVNAIKQVEENRRPQVEAFCFSVISSNNTLFEQFASSLQELSEINLGINREERLLRSQGAMFFLMKKNHILLEALKETYTDHQNYLPFVVEDFN